MLPEARVSGDAYEVGYELVTEMLPWDDNPIAGSVCSNAGFERVFATQRAPDESTAKCVIAMRLRRRAIILRHMAS